MQPQYNNIATTTTAASVAHPRGVRGLSLAILVEVFKRGVCTTKDLSELLELPSNYIRSYLYRLRRYGYLKKVGFFGWTITEECRYLYNIKELARATLEQQKSNNRATIEQQIATLSNTFLPKGKFKPDISHQLSIEPWIRKSDPGETEVVVVDMLVKHFNETGEKYIYLPGTIHQPDYYNISELIGCDIYAARDAITKLKQEGIIYLMADRSVGKWKLGLKKSFVAMLQYEAEVGEVGEEGGEGHAGADS